MTLHRFLREVGNEIMSGAEKMVFSSFAMLVLAVVVLLIMITMPGGISGVLEMHGWRLILISICTAALFLLIVRG